MAFECRVDDPGVACFGGAAWRREEDDELTLWGTIGWNAKDICDTWPWIARADPSLRITWAGGFRPNQIPGGYRGSLTPIATGALGTVMTENAFWIARFPHGSLPSDISVSIPLQNGHKRANGFLMPGGAAVGPGVCQDLDDSLRLTALTEDLKLRFDRIYRIPFFLRRDPDPQSGSRAICSVLSRRQGIFGANV